MKKIAFFLKNEVIARVDWNNIMKGNPGVGGSEYLVVLTAYILTVRGKYDVTLIVQKESNFPNNLKIGYSNNLHDAIVYCHENNIAFLVFKEYPRWIDENSFYNIPQDVGLIVWCHNFLSSRQLDFYDKIPSVKSVICVGREQVDLYRDHRLFHKMDYIYNGFPIHGEELKGLVPVSRRGNIVTYLGSIVPFKGFHILAKAWPIVLSRIPDAQLYVVGSASVYNENEHMGKYGIAAENYEKVFMPYLIDNYGRILPSVHFMGRMGEEKSAIIQKTKVGVPNPSGDTETFGIGAVEFEMMGCEVVTRKCCGYLDTVYNKSNLYSPRKAKVLAKYIIRALETSTCQYEYEEVYSFIDQFDIHKTVLEWEKLIDVLSSSRENKQIHDLEHNIPNLTFNMKWLRILYARFNRVFGYNLPCITKLSENKVLAHIRWLKNNYF